MDLADLRRAYTKAGLLESEVLSDPIEQFRVWFRQAAEIETREPNAMTLATADAEGTPDARTVLLKGVDAEGFRFFSNYESRKGRELEANPRATLLFYWPELERQVRIAGSVKHLSEEASALYFASRPLGHQLGAWASRQSTVVTSRKALEDDLTAVTKRFETGPVPKPPQWGGYVVWPLAIEFWQGRPDRLHDRLEYRRKETGWEMYRLSP